MIMLSKSPEETAGVAKRVLETLSQSASQQTVGKATVVGLYGDLGSGKTTFTKALAAKLGISEVITSPTFVIEKIYNVPAANYHFKKLVHIDAYRLEKGAELAKLGWEDVSADPETLILVEWPEHVADVLPPEHIIIKFRFVDSMTREIDAAILAV